MPYRARKPTDKPVPAVVQEIRTWRRRQRLTQQGAAKRLAEVLQPLGRRMSYHALCSWESGKTTPSLITAEILKEFLAQQRLISSFNTIKRRGPKVVKSKPTREIPSFVTDLRAWREKHGLSQREAAEALRKHIPGGRISKYSIRSWEQGRSVPHFKVVEFLKKLLDNFTNQMHFFQSYIEEQ